MAGIRHIKRRREQAYRANLKSATNRKIVRMQDALDHSEFSFDGCQSVLISKYGTVLQREDNSKLVISA